MWAYHEHTLCPWWHLYWPCVPSNAKPGKSSAEDKSEILLPIKKTERTKVSGWSARSADRVNAIHLQCQWHDIRQYGVKKEMNKCLNKGWCGSERKKTAVASEVVGLEVDEDIGFQASTNNWRG